MAAEPSQTDLKAALQEINDYDFEQFVADLWEQRGWETEVSNRSADRGVDVLATKEDGGFQTTAVIQAKRYQSGNNVGSPEVQQYASLRQQENADIAIVVTTSSFSTQAKAIANELNLKLVDGNQLVKSIESQGAQNLVRRYSDSLKSDSRTSARTTAEYSQRNRRQHTNTGESDDLERVQKVLNSFEEGLPEREVYSQSIPTTLWTLLVYASIIGWSSAIVVTVVMDSSSFVGLLGILSWILLPVCLFIDPHTVSRYSDWRPNPLFYFIMGIIPYINIIWGVLYLHRRRKFSKRAKNAS